MITEQSFTSEDVIESKVSQVSSGVLRANSVNVLQMQKLRLKRWKVNIWRVLVDFMCKK